MTQQYSDNIPDPEVAKIAEGYEYGWSQPENYAFKAPKGLSREVVEMISKSKDEPAWMLEFRLKALDVYNSKPIPTWGADLSALDLENIYYYIKPANELNARTWDDVPDDQGYAPMRDAIVRHVRTLLDLLR